MGDSPDRVLEGSTEQAEVWLTELAYELGGVGYLEAHRVLNAVLHAIRDGLSVEQPTAAEVLFPGPDYEDLNRPGPAPARSRRLPRARRRGCAAGGRG